MGEFKDKIKDLKASLYYMKEIVEYYDSELQKSKQENRTLILHYSELLKDNADTINKLSEKNKDLEKIQRILENQVSRLDGAVDYLNKKADSKKEKLKEKEVLLDALEEKLKKKEAELIEKEGELQSQLAQKNKEIEELKKKLQSMSQDIDCLMREEKMSFKQDIIKEEYSSEESKSDQCQNINVVSEVGNGDAD